MANQWISYFDTSIIQVSNNITHGVREPHNNFFISRIFIKKPHKNTIDIFITRNCVAAPFISGDGAEDTWNVTDYVQVGCENVHCKT